MSMEETLTGVRPASEEKPVRKESRRIKLRRIKNRIAYGLLLAATLLGVVVLAVLLFDIFRTGLKWVDIGFLTQLDSSFPEDAGIKAALWGSLWVIGVTAPLTFILGVGTAIYLEEYAKKGWLSRLIQLNISNLAGVPSVVFGILGLTLFVRGIGLGSTVLAGAFTLTLLILPIVIVASQEAIMSVPKSLRHASYAMGASRWQTVQKVVLPHAFPGILTGTILALSRALGETAPLIMIGAATFIYFTPNSVLDMFTVMPIQIFNWAGQPEMAFQQLAAAGIIVLLAVLLSMNALAVFLRNKFQNRL